ncbi:MAG: glutamyl-tRNA synthetase [Coxiella sp. DG_40]|nr:MAG: glutamyl-tRNA synthetase [Coxiella sp. DG_40]
MHLGNVRTALFNALLAKHYNGIFLLRIEDTDKIRSETRHTETLIEDLHWLDINWQEGPYWQSKRQAIYDKYYDQLESQGFAYPCFCTEQQLALNRKIQRASGKPPRYLGTCSSFSKQEIEKKLAAGLKPTLRFRVPQNRNIIFHDLVRGEQLVNSNDIGDFIIRRTDSTPPFVFCNAIDDALMGITHVLRGEDHLTNTPRQIMILDALNLPHPKYAHISLIVGSNGKPLSKRTGSRSIKELREQGFLAIAILNYLARLGHRYENENLMQLKELAEQFTENSLAHAPARFDYNQLLYWQKQAVSYIDEQEFYTWMGSSAQKLIPKEKLTLFINTIKNNALFPSEIEHWAKILCTNEFEYSDEQKAIIKDSGQLFFQTALTALEKFGTDFSAFANYLSETLSIKGKALFMPIRIALTGEHTGPELAHIFELLGKNRIKSRLELASTVLQ